MIPGLLLSVQPIFSQTYRGDDIPAELLENADAVMRLDAMDINFLAGDRMDHTATTVVTVLNAKGDRYANTRLHYDSSQKIKKLEAIIHDAAGNQIAELKRKDFKDVAAVDGFSLYIDHRLLYHEYVPTRYPCTMTFTYRVETADTGTLPSGKKLYRN